MSTPFADAERLIGAGTMSLLANATASIAGGAAVPCMFADDPAEMPLGQQGARGREVSVTVPQAAADGAVKGTAVTVVYRGASTAWKVADREVNRHLEQTMLQLVKA